MSRKYTIKEVRKMFKDNGCTLLSGEYKNNITNLKYRCVCGNISKTSLIRFNEGRRCMECGRKQAALSRMYSYEKVRNIFKEKGCKLLSKEYKGFSSKLRYKCICGNVSEITLTALKNGVKCKKCRIRKTSKSLIFSYEYVKKTFQENGCFLISDRYIGANSPLEYKCSCGNISRINFGHFKKGRRCRKCGINKVREKLKHSYSYVYNYFLKEGCELIDTEYVSCDSPLKYRCNCGSISKITFDSFRGGVRCEKCWREKMRGTNHPNYNFNLTDEERMIGRCYSEYVKWRKDVYTKNSYTCQKCRQIGGRLNAHHIFNYATHKNIRLDIGNGSTMCLRCHKRFHSLYGNRNNNQQQLKEFYHGWN